MHTHTPPTTGVRVGVDTHDQHVAAALDQLARLLGTQAAPSTEAGAAALLAWARRFEPLERVAIAGSGAYGPYGRPQTLGPGDPRPQRAPDLDPGGAPRVGPDPIIPLRAGQATPRVPARHMTPRSASPRQVHGRVRCDIHVSIRGAVGVPSAARPK